MSRIAHTWTFVLLAFASTAHPVLGEGAVEQWGRIVVRASPRGELRAIADSGYHSLALRSDGTVIGWGYNLYSQAQAPLGLTGVKAIAGGDYHSLALKSDGTVVGWGSNDYEQATPPAGLSGVEASAAGGNHSLALKNDGTVVVWGRAGSVPGRCRSQLLARYVDHSAGLRLDCGAQCVLVGSCEQRRRDAVDRSARCSGCLTAPSAVGDAAD